MYIQKSGKVPVSYTQSAFPSQRIHLKTDLSANSIRQAKLKSMIETSSHVNIQRQAAKVPEGKRMQQLNVKDNRKNVVLTIKNNSLQRQAYTYKKPLIGKNIIPPFYHAHFGFDDYQTLNHPVHVYQPNEESRQKNALLTNTVKDVGFGLAAGKDFSVITGGPGELFTYYNGVKEAGGIQSENAVSNNDNEDKLLVNSINEIGYNYEYKITDFNCQRWLDLVLDLFSQKKTKKNIDPTPQSSIESMIGREGKTDINTPLFAYYYGAHHPWKRKQSGLELLDDNPVPSSSPV